MTPSVFMCFGTRQKRRPKSLALKQGILMCSLALMSTQTVGATDDGQLVNLPSLTTWHGQTSGDYYLRVNQLVSICDSVSNAYIMDWETNYQYGSETLIKHPEWKIFEYFKTGLHNTKDRICSLVINPKYGMEAYEQELSSLDLKMNAFYYAWDEFIRKGTFKTGGGETSEVLEYEACAMGWNHFMWSAAFRRRDGWFATAWKDWGDQLKSHIKVLKLLHYHVTLPQIQEIAEEEVKRSEPTPTPDQIKHAVEKYANKNIQTRETEAPELTETPTNSTIKEKSSGCCGCFTKCFEALATPHAAQAIIDRQNRRTRKSRMDTLKGLSAQAK